MEASSLRFYPYRFWREAEGEISPSLGKTGFEDESPMRRLSLVEGYLTFSFLPSKFYTKKFPHPTIPPKVALLRFLSRSSINGLVTWDSMEVVSGVSPVLPRHSRPDDWGLSSACVPRGAANINFINNLAFLQSELICAAVYHALDSSVGRGRR